MSLYSHGYGNVLQQYPRLVIFLAGVVASTIVLHLPLGLARPGQITLAVFVLTLSLWIGELVPTGLSALLWGGLLVVLLGKDMPTTAVFGGFTKDTTWLMVGALLLGEATTETRVAPRIAYHLMSLGGVSYSRLTRFLWIAMFVLGMLVPSSAARAAIFLPIMIGIGDAFKIKRNTWFAANLLLNVHWSSMCAESLWYTGTNLNLTAMGVLEQMTGFRVTWASWAFYQIVPTAVLVIATYLAINRLFPPEKDSALCTEGVESIRQHLLELGPVSVREKKVLAIFGATVILWATEPFHKVPSAWVAALAGALLFMPGLGVLDKKSLNKISWNTVLLIGVALGIGNVMAQVELDTWFSQRLLGPLLMPLGTSLGALGIALGVGLFGFLIHFIIPSGTAQAAVISPLLIKFAITAGFDPRVTAMVIPRASADLLVFPYQSVPLMVLWGTGFMDAKKGILTLSVITVLQLAWQALMGPYWSWIMHAVAF